MYAFEDLSNTNKSKLVDEYALLPNTLYTAESVRAMDNFAINEKGIDGFELMNQAARFSFHSLVKHWPNAQNMIVLCGSGNNAGDGYIVASLAKKRSWNVTVFFASSPEKLQGDALKAYQSCLNEQVPCVTFDKDKFDALCQKPKTVIVDALLGTGLNAHVKGSYAEIIESANRQNCPILAIDIPSGLSADTGQALGVAIKADQTATFIGLKVGLFTGAGRQYSGKITYSDLGLEMNLFKHIKPIANRLDLHHLLSKLPAREKDIHKGSCGHTVIIGGDIAYGGASILSSSAAARIGSGLTTVLTQEAHRNAILSSTPEVMVFTSQNMQDIESFLKKASVIVIGPGLGQSSWSEKMLLAALNSQKPLVLDADALNLLSDKFSSVLSSNTFTSQNHIFTPHPGEASRLLQTTTTEIQSNRISSIMKLQKKWGGNILLKGSGSLIYTAEGSLSLCPYGNPGMASGGMGDVLSGLIGGLIAQGIDSADALQLAVCLHAKAADINSDQFGERGLLASDLIPTSRFLLNQNVCA